MSDSGIHFLDAQGPAGTRVYVIGDVHGCFLQLKTMHETILGEIARDKVADWRIVFVGDYCDRGPDVRATYDYLVECRRKDPRIVALLGNHDAGFLDFLAKPDAYGLFARHGGHETAASYGVDLDLRTPGSMRITHEALVRAVPTSHRDFIESLSLTVEFGDFFICHAGIRPGIALNRQDPLDLIWIRSEFLDFPGLHPRIIVHGHTPCAKAEIMPNRVNVDTGAVWNGMLTALVIDGPEKRLIQV